MDSNDTDSNCFYKHLTAGNTGRTPKLCKLLRHVHLPSKVKISEWYIAWLSLQTAEKPRKSGMDINAACCLCNSLPENIDHLLLQSSFAQDL
ncbi:hypothetical protein FRX31_009951 [Thalictrum thalictroides]|uniref:Reverse transcriptase zinc-binding domain-containing protein n=1 Tax=Thalictrum thalictroides TaxID=46969 RepID=A0A7J6WTW7_THATH|nr:hypothetical protein FRX31_009951 [Thalictrum thalictroides]